MKACVRTGMAVVLTIGLSACASIKPGVWEMRAPDGATTSVTVSLLRDKEYYLSAPKNPISGVYTLNKTALRSTKPDNPRMGGYVWNLNKDGSLILVEETPVQVSGQRLTSATMKPIK